MFYVITNTFSWFIDPGYVKNFAGLIQVADGWFASIQRDTDLDVFPQFTRQRSYFSLVFLLFA